MKSLTLQHAQTSLQELDILHRHVRFDGTLSRTCNKYQNGKTKVAKIWLDNLEVFEQGV